MPRRQLTKQEVSDLLFNKDFDGLAGEDLINCFQIVSQVAEDLLTLKSYLEYCISSQNYLEGSVPVREYYVRQKEETFKDLAGYFKDGNNND